MHKLWEEGAQSTIRSTHILVTNSWRPQPCHGPFKATHGTKAYTFVEATLFSGEKHKNNPGVRVPYPRDCYGRCHTKCWETSARIFWEETGVKRRLHQHNLWTPSGSCDKGGGANKDYFIIGCVEVVLLKPIADIFPQRQQQQQEDQELRNENSMPKKEAKEASV